MANKYQMITLSGCIGIGLYIPADPSPAAGGPLATIMSFALVGLLAWGVMVTIADMVSIRPISLRDMSTVVTEFVDVELGIVVGVAYW